MHSTRYLPGFSHRLCGRRARPVAEQVRRRAERLDGLAALIARFLPRELFALAGKQRERVYTPWVTMIAFLSQVLTRCSACREAVRRVQVWRLAARRSIPDESTSAYCQARARLSLAQLRAAHEQVSAWIARHTRDTWQWCGHHVKVLDGCGVSMPDTDANRQAYPYASCQKPGCGFPTGQMVGLFCLATGRLVRFVLAGWKAHEIPLARQLVDWLEPDEVVLADRGFCGWGLIALMQRKGAQVVMRVHQFRKLSGRTMVWPRPQRPVGTWSEELWAQLPRELAMRIVRFRVEVPGFRTEHVVLATTLLDERKYPDAELAALYRRRWNVELCFRNIKVTLGLDVLRCQTPALVEKEAWMHALAYNLIRALMLEAARTHHVDPARLSFKGTVDALRQWTPLFAHRSGRAREARRALLHTIAADHVPDRPNRAEPRARKRRPKPYAWLTSPRHEMVVAPSRNLK